MNEGFKYAERERHGKRRESINVPNFIETFNYPFIAPFTLLYPPHRTRTRDFL